MDTEESIKDVSEDLGKVSMSPREFKRQKRLIAFRKRMGYLILGSCLAIGIGNEVFKEKSNKTESVAPKKTEQKSHPSDKIVKESAKVYTEERRELPTVEAKKVVPSRPKKTIVQAMPIRPTRPDPIEAQDESEMPILVDFWAPWCGPCRQVHPILDALEKEMAGRIKIVRIDITTEEGERLASQFKVGAIPSLRIIKNGQIVENWVGNTGKADFKNKLQKYIRR